MRVCKWHKCGNEVIGTSNKEYCNNKCKMVATVTRHRQERKKQCVEYLGGKCIYCGYNKSFNALQFHHKRDKKFKIGSGYTKSWDIIKEELDKCELVCANCHAEQHEIEYLNLIHP